MKKHMFILPVFLVAVVALVLGAAAPEVQAQDDPSVCFFNIEFNATDLDVGVRGFFDYEPWDRLEIEDPDGDRNARVWAEDDLGDQGFAEWFFESGEPELAELSFGDFLDRFLPGSYVFDARTIEGDSEDCTAIFTHVIPCAPEINASGNRGVGVTISWDPVTTAVNTDATDDAVEEDGEEAEVVCYENGPAINIVGYEVIVETEVDGVEKIYEIDLPGDVYSVKVPPEFIALGDEFQFEVLAIEASGNQTITEEEFCLNESNGQVEECPDDE